jgi:hypothetical protein
LFEAIATFINNDYKGPNAADSGNSVANDNGNDIVAENEDHLSQQSVQIIEEKSSFTGEKPPHTFDTPAREQLQEWLNKYG